MKEKIKKICKELEEDKKIKILFAVENGSRAWRMESKDSDYDVRFVFVRSLEEYLMINKHSDVITAHFDKEGKHTKPEGAFIDMSGFDVIKFARLLSSSNPTCIEWLTSDIVYYGKQNRAFKEFAEKNYNPLALYHHYKSMCYTNYIKYLRSGTLVTYKKYLYAFRGLVNAKWVAHKKSVPPIIFKDALKGMKTTIPYYVERKLDEIIRLKSSGKEKDIIQNIVKLDNYIEDFIKDHKEAPQAIKNQEIDSLNKEIAKIIKLPKSF